MSKIKFGTDGWRGIIAKDFTVDNVLRVTYAVAKYLKQNYNNASVVIGHDCRFGGEIFCEAIAKFLANKGIKTYLHNKGFVSTPMVSLGVKKLNATLGIVITASHNPPIYNGYKLKGEYGGPLTTEKTSEIEKLIPEKIDFNIDKVNANDLIETVNLEDIYYNEVIQKFDIELIKNCNLTFAYDAMYGAGQNIVKRLFPNLYFLHCEYNPSFNGIPPEPIYRNLTEFSEFIKKSKKINCGLTTDGDADRIGLFDSSGNFVDSHHIILLLIKYLVEVKKMKGKIVSSVSVTPRIKKLCKYFNLEHKTVKIGFKHIADLMIKDDVLLGGEESGGIAIKGHIPERDGIWMGLTIWEYMAKSGKTLEELISELYKIVGTFAYERLDWHLPEEDKIKIIKNCEDGIYKSFAGRKVLSIEKIDGFKYYLENEEWIMIRASGTEPVLRIYAESNNKQNAINILNTAKKELEKKLC